MGTEIFGSHLMCPHKGGVVGCRVSIALKLSFLLFQLPSPFPPSLPFSATTLCVFLLVICQFHPPSSNFLLLFNNHKDLSLSLSLSLLAFFFFFKKKRKFLYNCELFSFVSFIIHFVFGSKIFSHLFLANLGLNCEIFLLSLFFL